MGDRWLAGPLHRLRPCRRRQLRRGQPRSRHQPRPRAILQPRVSARLPARLSPRRPLPARGVRLRSLLLTGCCWPTCHGLRRAATVNGGTRAVAHSTGWPAARVTAAPLPPFAARRPTAAAPDEGCVAAIEPGLSAGQFPSVLVSYSVLLLYGGSCGGIREDILQDQGNLPSAHLEAEARSFSFAACRLAPARSASPAPGRGRRGHS
jgi:hypothetical protein